MLEGRGKWQRQPTQPVEWDDKNPLAEGLVSLVVLIQGRWIECGPYGSCAPLARAGTNTVTYKAPAPYLGGGSRSDALQMATQSTAVGEGYYFDYGRNIIATSVEAVTAFALGYCDEVNTSAKYLAAWGNSSAYAFTMRYGDGAAGNARRFDFLQSGTDSFRGMAANTAGIVDFMSGSKTIAGSAPVAYINGVVSSGSSANGTGILSSPINRVAIGNSSSLAIAGTSGGCCLAGAYDRELTAEEHVELAKNPWQLIRPRSARIYSFPSPNAAPTISSTNNSNTLIDEASFVITGTALTSATAVTFKQTNRPDYDATAFITANDATTVTLSNLDVQDMSMAYGAATVAVTTAAGTSADFAITIAPQAGHTHITLASTDAGVEWLDLTSADGDLRVSATTTALGGTFAFVGATGAYTITYAGDAPSNDSIYWAEFDDSTDQWYESIVSINSSGAGIIVNNIVSNIVKSIVNTGY